MRHRFCFALAMGLAFVLSTLGCNGKPPTGTVTGTVRFKGEPVYAGKVLFASPDGRTASALFDRGTYTVEGVPLGAVKVSVNVLNPSGPGEGKALPLAKLERYTATATSGLSTEVHEGTQTYDIELVP